MTFYEEIYNYIVAYIVPESPLATLLAYTGCVLVFVLAVKFFMMMFNIVFTALRLK